MLKPSQLNLEAQLTPHHDHLIAVTSFSIYNVISSCAFFLCVRSV